MSHRHARHSSDAAHPPSNDPTIGRGAVKMDESQVPNYLLRISDWPDLLVSLSPCKLGILVSCHIHCIEQEVIEAGQARKALTGAEASLAFPRFQHDGELFTMTVFDEIADCR